MCDHAKSLNICCDLTAVALEQGVLDLREMLKRDNKEGGLDVLFLYLVCSDGDMYEAAKVVRDYLDSIAVKDVKIEIRRAGYLFRDAWFITNGEKIVFTPGA